MLLNRAEALCKRIIILGNLNIRVLIFISLSEKVGR